MSNARALARRLISAPGLRLLAPGWPDSGRQMVQRPVLEVLLGQAVSDSPPPSSVLNAGCGEGLYSPTIRRFANGARMFEFDFGPPPARRDSRIHRFTASLDAVALKTASIDLVLCTEVLEHVANDEAAVSELRRLLSPRGWLVLTVPTPPAVFDPAHVREGYTLANLRALFARHGLEIVSAQYSMHAFFKAVLRYWRPRRMPLGVILALSWLDTVFKIGPPMDLAVLARRSDVRSAAFSNSQHDHV